MVSIKDLIKSSVKNTFVVKGGPDHGEPCNGKTGDIITRGHIRKVDGQYREVVHTYELMEDGYAEYRGSQVADK